jgi:hypothetical protein
MKNPKKRITLKEIFSLREVKWSILNNKLIVPPIVQKFYGIYPEGVDGCIYCMCECMFIFLLIYNLEVGEGEC